MGSVETRAFAFVVVKRAAKVNDRLSRRRKQIYIHHWLFWIGCHFNKNSTPLERHPNAQKILKLWTMSVHQYLERRFQDLMKFVERLPRLFLYFGPQRAVEQDDQEGKFRQEPVYKLGGRAVLFLSDSVRLHHLLMRANVTNGQTFGGNSWQINFAHISKLSTPQWKTNHSILRLAEYRFIFEKIDYDWIHQNAASQIGKNPRTIKSTNPEKQSRNTCCQQFEKFLTIYLHDLTWF